jgi:hypothetical protein
MHEKSNNKDNLTNACQSESTEVETLAKTPNIEFKSLSSSLRYEFLDLNETYLIFMNVNLELAQIKPFLVFSLKIGTFDHVSWEPFENFSKHVLNTWKNYDAVVVHKVKIKRAT